MTAQQPWRRQHGGVAILVALSLTVLIGFIGLVLDLGRLYVNRSELQNAADACALAAAAELNCDPDVAGACTPAYLERAEAIGRFVAGQNRRDFQGQPVSIHATDVRFHTALAPNEAYLARSNNPSPSARYVMCIARANGITPWFMGVLGQGPSDLQAYAVATLQPAQRFCSSSPIGVCSKPGHGAPHFGFTPGEWIESAFNSGGNGDVLEGNFRWVDFDPPAGGTEELREEIAGVSQRCNLSIGDPVEEYGVKQGAKSAYNVRFGLYQQGANAFTPETAPPDYTGYAYPDNSGIGIGVSALADYLAHQGNNTPFSSSAYGISGPGGNIPGNAISEEMHHDWGRERRLLTVPMIDCDATHSTPIVGVGCVLMLNPMANGANGVIYLEFIGEVGAAGVPCRTSGAVGGSGSGPLVPTLVQ